MSFVFPVNAKASVLQSELAVAQNTAAADIGVARWQDVLTVTYQVGVNSTR